MPDTAVKNLVRFANIYNVPQDQPVAASGNVIVSGAPNTPLPTDLTFTFRGSSVTYASTAGATIGSTGTVSVPVVATQTGTTGNLAAGATLTISSPVEGLTSQTGTVDQNGIANGANLESVTSWRSRILARIAVSLPAAITATTRNGPRRRCRMWNRRFARRRRAAAAL